MNQFNKLRKADNSYYFTHKRNFSTLTKLSEETLNLVFEFAFEMTFGRVGEHRDHRSGGY